MEKKYSNSLFTHPFIKAKFDKNTQKNKCSNITEFNYSFPMK